MGLRAALFVLASASGCAQIAGIEETSGPDESARVHMTVERVSVGANLVRAPQDLTGQMATYLVPDDAQGDGFVRLPADHTDLDQWSLLYPSGAPALMFTLPDHGGPRTRIWDLGARDMQGVFSVYEHLNPVPLAMDEPAAIDASITLPTPYVTGETFQFYAVGTWNRRAYAEVPLDGETTFDPAPFELATTETLTGRPHERITTADSVFLLRHQARVLTGVIEAAPFDLAATQQITGTMSAVAADQMLTVTIDPASVPARYQVLRPGPGAPGMAWNVVAAPGRDILAALGPELISAGIGETDPGALMRAYGNPFAARGWQPLFTFATSATRAYVPTNQPGGATLSINLRSELYARADPMAGGTVELAASFPELIDLAGTLLTTDGVSIARPTRAVPVSFTTAAPGTLYAVELLELVPNAAGTALVHKFVISALSTTPSFLLPPELFEPGKNYTLRAVTYVGSYPNLATGDLATRSLPLSAAVHDSGAFTVMP